jgi:hypothetical protein
MRDAWNGLIYAKNKGVSRGGWTVGGIKLFIACGARFVFWEPFFKDLEQSSSRKSFIPPTCKGLGRKRGKPRDLATGAFWLKLLLFYGS